MRATMAHVKGKPGSHLVRDALRRVMVAFTAILVLLAGTVFLLGFVIGAGQAHWLVNTASTNADTGRGITTPGTWLMSSTRLLGSSRSGSGS